MDIETPRAFLPLLQPRRYKGVKGGRGSGKSHFFAEMIVEECLLGHTRAVCLREFQKSIKDSSKQLIEDKIVKLGVTSRFEILEQEIRGPNDSLIVFRGLANHTAASIKSLEGFTRAWVDEAQSISRRSFDMLYPTIRATGSELWFSWNPHKQDDPVDEFFEQNKSDPDVLLLTANWDDNPWFPEELRKDMLRDQARDPSRYAHIWLGDYAKNSEAQVFKNWKVESFDPPADARFYLGADWGFSIDPTVLVRCYINGRTLYIDQEAYRVGCEIDRTPALFDTVEGSRKWPIRADSARPETISYMQRHGYPNITPANKGAGSVEDGIEFLKSYDIIVHPRCKHTIDELSMYSYKIDKRTNEVLPVLEDAKNHVIDALRYSVELLRKSKPVIAPIAESAPSYWSGA